MTLSVLGVVSIGLASKLSCPAKYGVTNALNVCGFGIPDEVVR